MADERDLEIARLRGQLEGLKASKAQGGAAIGTLKVLGTLGAVAAGGLALLLFAGAIMPDPPSISEQQAQCREQYGEATSPELVACMQRNLERELERRR